MRSTSFRRPSFSLFARRRASLVAGLCLALVGGPGGCDENSPADTDDGASETSSSETSSSETDDEQIARMHVHAADASGVAAAAVLDAEGDTVTLYVCGDAETVQSHTRWFFALPIGPQGEFEGTDEGWTLTGAVSGGGVDAQLLTPDGETLTLGFDPIPSTGASGLYVASGPGCETGLVAWEDTSAAGGLGFQGAWCDEDGTKEQVIILQPDAFTAEGGQAGVVGRDDVAPFTMTRF